jgi:hypothetical protein
LPVPAEILARDNWRMLGVALLLFPLMKTGMRVNLVGIQAHRSLTSPFDDS